MRIGVGLSIPELATRGGRFSPASLFTGGVQGAWYAPDDFSTLFQDSAGTTPVTAVEQPVGLMLDKSQGGLGPELVTNGGFSSSSNWTLSNTTITGGNLVFGVAFGYASQAISGTAGNYKLLVSKSVGFAGAGNLTFAFYNAGSMVGSAISIGSATLTFGSGIVTASGSFDEIRIACSTTDAYQIDSVSLARAPGNHASQATAASRPVLRARYNLLTYSEQFDSSGPWYNSITGTGVNSTVTANQGTAPDGTVTADRIQLNLGGGTTTGDFTRRIQSYVTAAVTHTYSIYLRSYDGVSTYNMHLVGPTGGTTNIVVTGSWQRFEVTATGTGASVAYAIGLRGGQTPANSNTADVLAWGAQVVTGSSAGTYQRIAAATDYATAGFLPYLALDGTDDSFGTNSIDFTATDKMSVCAGVTKLSDAASAMVAELSANAVLNAGAFNIQAPATGGNAEYRYGGGGTIFRTVLTSSYAAPITNVLAATQDIVGDAMNLRVNGVSVGTSALDQGTGNFGNYPLFIGRRNNSSTPFNGRIYQLIVCGKTLSASELASTEAYVATKTGVTL